MKDNQFTNQVPARIIRENVHMSLQTNQGINSSEITVQRLCYVTYVDQSQSSGWEWVSLTSIEINEFYSSVKKAQKFIQEQLRDEKHSHLKLNDFRFLFRNSIYHFLNVGIDRSGKQVWIYDLGNPVNIEFDYSHQCEVCGSTDNSEDTHIYHDENKVYSCFKQKEDLSKFDKYKLTIIETQAETRLLRYAYQHNIDVDYSTKRSIIFTQDLNVFQISYEIRDRELRIEGDLLPDIPIS